MRFLLPMMLPAGLLLLRLFESEAQGQRKRWRSVFSPRLIKVLVGLHVVSLLGFTAFGLVKDRQRIERALWDLPANTTVLSSVNFFGDFDRALARIPSQRSYTHWVRMFSKPPHITFVYVPDELFLRACQANHNQVVLLTNDHDGVPLQGRQQALDINMRAISRFPPPWLHMDAAWYRRMWRYQLVRCHDYEATVRAAGLLHALSVKPGQGRQ